MSTQHHGESARQSELFRKLQQQNDGTRQREWPHGRVSGDDDGELALAISSDAATGLVRMDFGKPVAWMAMSPDDAVALAQLLIRHARAISKEPLRVVLN